MTLAPLTIEQFQRRFFLEGCPYWFAYNASNKREQVGKFRNDEPDFEGDDLLEYSWMQFVDLVETYPFGHLKVECKSSPNANSTKSPVMYVKWGQGHVANTGGHISGPMTGQQNMGNQWGMFQYMLEMQNRHFSEMRRLSEENQRVNYENRSLAEALEADGEPTFKEKMLLEGIGAVKDLLRPRLNLPQQQPAVAGNLGTMGQRQSVAPDGGQSRQEPQPQQPRRRSLDDIMQDLTVIQQCLPDMHINDITRSLALFVKNNPAQASGLLQPLITDLYEQQRG